MSTPEKAKKIAEEYLEKNGHENFALKDTQDKIAKWVLVFENPENEFEVEVSKSGATVIQFIINKK